MALATYDITKTATTPATTSRKLYFDGLGVDIQAASNLEEAIIMSGLNFGAQKLEAYACIKNPVRTNPDGTIEYEEKFIPMKDRFGVFKVYEDLYGGITADEEGFLGDVGKNYNILQNEEAFDFLDGMLGAAKFETAGYYGRNNAQAFITMSTDGFKILGDDFANYILLTNSFDGTSTVKVAFTNTRVFCSNTIMRALRNSDAQNRISITHCKTLKDRLAAAREVLLENTKYMDALKEEAELLAVKPFSRDAFIALANKLYPTDITFFDDALIPQGKLTDEQAEKKVKKNVIEFRHLMEAYDQVDLDNFEGSAWRAVQAACDHESHAVRFKTGTKAESYRDMNTITSGMPIMNLIADYVYDFV